MGQRIGKNIATIILGIGIQISYASQVMLKIVDQSGVQVRTVGVGIPFEIQVVVDGTLDIQKEPVITTDPQLPLRSAGTSTHMTTINGTTSVKRIYTYQTRCQQEGTYTVGPVQIVLADGKTISSPSLQIKAVVQHQAAHHNEQYKQAYVQLLVDKKNLYVGEKAQVAVRFYYTDERVQLDGIANPEFPSCHAQPLEGPLSGSEVKDGVVYRYLEWKTELFPTKAGTITLPAVAADVLMIHKGRRRNNFDIFSMMDEMMGGGVQRRTMYSNAVVLQVKPLPDNDSAVQAVGNFTKLTSAISAQTALQGEGVVYTLELLGSGNFEAIDHPSLLLPEELSVYESNIKMHDLGNNLHKKDFEYIIQGTMPGEYTIDYQSLTFFDPKAGHYKTLQTQKKFTLQITPGAFSSTSTEKQQDEIFDDNKEKEELIYDDFPLVHVTQWRGKKSRMLSWSWFLVMSGLLLLCTLILQLRVFFKRRLRYCSAQAGYYFAAKNAKKALQEAQKEGNIKAVHGIFINYCAQRLGCSQELLNYEYIEKILIKRGMQEKTLDAWQAFFEEVSAVKFANVQLINNDVFFTLSYEWIEKLEKYL